MRFIAHLNYEKILNFCHDLRIGYSKVAVIVDRISIFHGQYLRRFMATPNFDATKFESSRLGDQI